MERENKMPTKKLQDLYGWVNFSYIGLAAGILSIIVSMYNISKYYQDIKEIEKQ